MSPFDVEMNSPETPPRPDLDHEAEELDEKPEAGYDQVGLRLIQGDGEEGPARPEWPTVRLSMAIQRFLVELTLIPLLAVVLTFVGVMGFVAYAAT